VTSFIDDPLLLLNLPWLSLDVIHRCLNNMALKLQGSFFVITDRHVLNDSDLPVFWSFLGSVNLFTLKFDIWLADCENWDKNIFRFWNIIVTRKTCLNRHIVRPKTLKVHICIVSVIFSYDMFEEQNASAGQYASGWDPQATYGYYDPNAYQQPSPQPPVQPQQPRAGPSSTKGHPPPSGWGPKFEMNSRTWH